MPTVCCKLPGQTAKRAVLHDVAKRADAGQVCDHVATIARDSGRPTGDRCCKQEINCKTDSGKLSLRCIHAVLNTPAG
eukprot:263745-Alexandrium_andersonii.AAC.1